VVLAAANQPFGVHLQERQRRQAEATQVHGTRGAARSVVQAVKALLEVHLSKPDMQAKWPRWRL
jgi:hypothetical protein